jgi:hypothetical protein
MFAVILRRTPRCVWELLAALSVTRIKQALTRRGSLRGASTLSVVAMVVWFYGVALVFFRRPLALGAWDVAAVAVLWVLWVRWAPQARAKPQTGE